MKITINGHEFNINYVWDREDKYLIVTDDVNQIKYTSNTYSSTVDKHSIDRLIFSYAKNILGIEDLKEWSWTGKPNKVCHNDDFYNHYRKTYKLVNFSESNLRY